MLNCLKISQLENSNVKVSRAVQSTIGKVGGKVGEDKNQRGGILMYNKFAVIG